MLIALLCEAGRACRGNGSRRPTSRNLSSWPGFLSGWNLTESFLGNETRQALSEARFAWQREGCDSAAAHTPVGGLDLPFGGFRLDAQPLVQIDFLLLLPIIL